MAMKMIGERRIHSTIETVSNCLPFRLSGQRLPITTVKPHKSKRCAIAEPMLPQPTIPMHRLPCIIDNQVRFMVIYFIRAVLFCNRIHLLHVSKPWNRKEENVEIKNIAMLKDENVKSDSE